jgi:hypothetical protein
MKSGGHTLLATQTHTQEVGECLDFGHGLPTAVLLVSYEFLGVQTDQVGNGLDFKIKQDVEGAERQSEVVGM